MQNLQTSLFYDLQELIRTSSLLRKYYLIFKALDLSALKDKNTGVGADVYSSGLLGILLSERFLLIRI